MQTQHRSPDLVAIGESDFTGIRRNTTCINFLQNMMYPGVPLSSGSKTLAAYYTPHIPSQILSLYAAIFSVALKLG